MILKQKVLAGTKWLMFANIFKQGLQLISLIVFARLLSVDDFGTYAILMIFVGFLQMFTDMGTSAALTHIEKPSNELFSSVFFFNVFVGVFLFIGLTLLANPISIFFDDIEIEKLLQLISINFVISSFGVVQKAKFEKKLDFKRLTLAESAATLISISFGIASALYGFGVYSLIIQTLTNSIVLVILMWVISTWRPMLYFSQNDIKRIWSYTANLSSFQVINYFARNADNFLIGKFIGSSALGVYSLAYKVMLFPLQNISQVLIRILFPAFSQIQNDNVKFRNAYLRVIFFISLITFPIMAGLIATADIFVDVVFGNKWENLSLILIILAPVGMMQSIVTTIGSIFMAKGNTKAMFKIGGINAIVTVISFIVGIPFGVEAVAFSYLIANLIMLYPNLKIAWKQIDLTVTQGLMELLPIFLISIFMGVLIFLLGIILNYFIGIPIIELIILVLIGSIFYLSMIRIKYGKILSLIGQLRK